MSNIIQYRRGTAAAWTSANPTLASGEPGFETDTGLIKVGDGSTSWTSLSYQAGNSGLFTSALMDNIADPGATASGKMRIYAHAIANRMMPKFVGPSGLDSAIQPLLARNKIG